MIFFLLYLLEFVLTELDARVVFNAASSSFWK